MGKTTDLTPECDATQEELRQYEIAREKIKKLDTSGTYDASNPNQKLFFVSFDGTRNDSEDSTPGNIHTNPALLKKMVTNTENVSSKYIHGVGTRTNDLLEEFGQSATGAGSVDRAEVAYERLIIQVKKWHDDNPNIEVHVSTAGFSRGTGSQRHFANLVHERGIPDPDGDGYLIPPGGVHQDVMLMYDSVVTGQEHELSLGIPPSVVAVHLTADHENRLNFDSASIVDPLYPNDPGILETGLPGSHSDIGGNYGYNGLSARSLALGHELLGMMGVPINEIPIGNMADSDDIMIHDSGVLDWDSFKELLMSFGNIELGEREDFIAGNPARFAQLPPEVQEEALRRLEAEREAEEAEIFGYNPEEWAELNDLLKKAENIEVVGDDITELINSYEEGNDWEILESTSDLLSSIDRVLADNLELENLGVDDLSDTIQGVSGIVSAIGGWKELEEAFSNGDGWGVAEGGSTFVSGVTKAYDNFSDIDVSETELGKIGGAATSVVSLGIKVHDLLEALEGGDDTAQAKAALEVIESAAQAYVAVNTAVGGTSSALSTSLPAIGAAVGIASGVLSMLDGDAQGGGEQIVISCATYVLCCIPVFGWAAALALQVASATRHMDGQLVDKESVENWADDVVPLGGEAMSAVFGSHEIPAKIVSEVYQQQSYLTGVNLQMFDDIGIDIPEEMRSEFELAQTGLEAANVLRIAEYFQDIDEISLADMWDSTYITPSVAAIIEAVRDLPDFAKSVVTDVPGVAVDAIKSSLNPESHINLVKGMFGIHDPDEATASFTFDENGNVIMNTSGDSSMEGLANSLGGQVLSVMQGYKDGGGRLLINGNMPSIKVTQGEDSQINYGSDSGKITVLMDDLSKAPIRMRGVLIARDHGERLSSAVKVATFPGGDIDWSKVDSVMAGHGFTKRGDNYVFGETRELYGTTAGTGVFRGGGQMGPEGQHFSANSANITSLPLKTSKLPSQQLGEIAKIVSAKNFFSGSGCELAAMSLILGAGFIGSPEKGYATTQQKSELVNQPLDSVSLEKYLASLQDGTYQENEAKGISGQVSFPLFEDDKGLHEFFKENWSELLNGSSWDEESKSGAIQTRGTEIGYNGLLADGTKAPWWNKNDSDDFFENQLGEEARAVTGNQVLVDDVQLDSYSHMIQDDIEVGAFFTMSEDAVMRFLPSSLLEDSVVSRYSGNDEQLELVSFNNVKNGKVWIDQNGDIRFEPTANFVGTASFTYTFKNTEGTLIEKQALIQVSNVNDDPTIKDDAFTLQEGDTFYLDRLLANDVDIDGDTILIDHFRGVENGTIDLVNGELAFIPDEGFYGDVSFTYWVRDHVDSYPVMGRVSLRYQDVNNGAVAHDDRFLILEDSQVITTPEKLLENDKDYDGELPRFAGLGETVNGTVSMQDDGSILFTPKSDYAGSNCGFYYSIEDESGNLTKGWVNVDVLDQREPPVVTSGTMSPIFEDEVFTFSPNEVANFIFDADGDDVHLDSITNIVGGKVIIQDGYLSFSPDANYSGSASFDYRANDNHRGTVEGHLSFEVLAVNDAIVIGEDQLTTVEETLVTTSVTDLLANDTDVDGNIIAFAGLGVAEHGTVSIDSMSNITFIPEENYSGDQAGFEYFVTDSEGVMSTGWVQVSVDNVNDMPEIISNTLNSNEDEPLVFNAATVATLFKDADGDNLTVTRVDAISGGVVTNQDGVFTFTPDENYAGDAQVEITVNDGNGGEQTELVDLAIVEQDDQAIIGADSLNSVEEQSVTTTVATLLQNDSDVDGVLTFDGIGQVFHGEVSVSASGEIVFTPEEDYFGSDAGFEYKVIDEKGYPAVGVVKVEVAGVNDAPVIIESALTTLEDEPIIFTEEVLSKFISDVDGDTVSISSIDNVTGGTISENGGVYTFTPDPDYHGSGFFEYSATDNNGETVTGSLDISILAQNDETNFGSDAFLTDEEQPVVTSVSELLGNDRDRDGELEFSRLGEVKHGSVELAGDGSIIFTPEKDYSGNDAGFYYTVEDAEGYESTGWVTVGVQNVNDTPVIIGNRLRINEDEQVAFTSEEISKFLFDADGDLYSLDLVANVEGGRLELNNGIYTFIPDENYYGDGSFDYTAVSSSGDRVDGTMNLVIAPVNDLPQTSSTSANGIEDHEIVFQIDQLMASASDVEDGSNIKFDGINSSLNGDVYIDNETGKIHFLPDDNFFGDAAFSYDVIDSEGGISEGYVAVRVTGVNDAPVAADDDKIVGWSNNLYENVYLASVFLGNDKDVDNDSLSIIAVGDAEFGSVSLDVAGNIHYTAMSDDWVGIDTFTYTITDGSGETSTATVNLDVKINTSPDVYPEILYTQEDIISIIKQDDLLANDSDVDGDVMQIIGVDQAEHCEVELLANGDIKFTPELNYNNNYPEQASFRYTVTDGISDPVTTVAFFDIDPVNDAPILVSERIDGAIEDNSFSFTVAQLMANDTDVEMASPYEEDSISFVEVFDAAHGTIYSDDTGTIFYTPDPNFCKTETFKYKVVDSYGAESIIESEIWVEPVNDIPVVQFDVATSTAEDSIWNKHSISGLVANDVDVDGDNLTIKNASVVAGSASVKIEGGYLQVKPGFREDYVEIKYTVSDGNGGDVESKLTIPNIREHNFAPEITNTYATTYSNGTKRIFSFLVEDKNGGDNWSGNGANMGQIASISIGNISTNYPSPHMTEENSAGHFSFWYWGTLFPNVNYYANFTITAVDYAGASSTKYVSMDQISWSVGSHHYPVILDLDGDGVELLSAKDGVTFDWQGYGEVEKTGWAGKDDGFLVYDHDGDQQVTQANEIALKEYHPDAKTDLEGLRGFDSNNNGLFDVGDEKWQEFGVWQDKNSNGITDEGEFSTLDQQGIVSIDLQSDENYREENDNVVYGGTTYQKSDGSVHEVLDVGLNGEMTGAIEVENPRDPINNSSATTSDTLLSPDEAETPNSLNGESLPIDNALTDAELDRQFIQMQSDLATHSATENESQNLTIFLPEAPLDGQSIIDEQGQEYQIA